MNFTRTLLAPLSNRSQTLSSKMGLSKTASEQSERLRDGNGIGQHNERAYAEQSYTTIPIPLSTIHVQKDTGVGVSGL